MKLVQLSEVAGIVMGTAPPGESYNDLQEGLPLIAGASDYGLENPKPKRWTTQASAISEPGDLIICVRATIGDLNWSDRSYCLGRGVAALRPDTEKLNPQYLGHYMNAKKAELSALGTGSTFPAIRKNDLESFQIPLPPLPEQKRIADILDKADAIRRKRREAISMIHDLRRSSYLHLFGDPATNSRNWPIMNMSEIVKDTQYGTPEKSSTEQAGFPVLRMNNITSDGDIDLTDIKWCNLEEREIEKFTIKKGDLLFNRTNSPELVGKTAVWDVSEEYAFAGYLVRVRFDSEKATPEYVSGFLNSPFGKKMIFSKAKPSNNMSNFSASEFCRIEIPVPHIDLQRQFSEYVSRLREVRRRFDSAQQQTSDLFSALVQQSFMNEE